MKPKDLAIYVFLALTWGLSFMVVLRVIDAFGWIGAVVFRSFIASAALFAMALLSRKKLDFSIGWWPLAVVGATTVAGQLIGLTFATPRIGTAMTAILVATIPLFSMLIGQIWGTERMTAQGFAGLVLGFGGIVLLVGFPSVPVTTSFVLGCLGALLGTLSAAFGSNYASQRLKAVGAWEVTIGSFLVGGLMTLPLLPLVPVPAMPGPGAFFYLALSGAVMSGLNYVLYFKLVSSIGPTRTISVEFMVTVVAVLVGAFFLHESLSPVQVAGAAIIVGGCAMVLGLFPALGRARQRP